MGLFLADRVESHGRGDRPSRRGDAEQTPLERRGEDDRSIPSPRAAAWIARRLSKGLRRAARELGALELASGEKAQGSGVRGPERLTRAFRSGQRACDEGIEGTDPEGGVPIRVSGRESQPVPIRRHGHGIGKRSVCRGDHLQTNGAGAARSGTTEVGERQGEAGQQEKTRGSPSDSLRERSPFLGSNGPPPRARSGFLDPA